MGKKEIIQDELKQLAPGLPLQQQSTFQAPNGYFDELPGKLLANITSEEKKDNTVYFFESSRWKVFAAAAVTVGILFFSFYYFTKSTNDGVDAINQWAKQEVSKLPTKHVSDYIDNTNAFLQTASTSEEDSKDLALFVQDIPQEEIQKLLNDLPVTEMP